MERTLTEPEETRTEHPSVDIHATAEAARERAGGRPKDREPVFELEDVTVAYDGNPAVHYGDHHGLEMTLVLITALIASRWLGGIGSRSLQTGFGLATGLVLAYSLMNIANDAWLEQVVKRGWTNWEIPGVLVPAVTWGWAVILLGGLALWLTLFRPRRAETTREGLTAGAEPESVRVWNCGRPGKQAKER